MRDLTHVASTLLYAHLFEFEILSGRRLITQRKSESRAEWQLLIYFPRVQSEKKIREEYGVSFIDNGPNHDLMVGRYILGIARRQIVPFNRDTI
jgi:hypothetical protein